MSDKKNFVLDTNILLDDDTCVTKGFDDNNIIIPLEVIQELDGIKKDKGSRGYSARSVLRSLDGIINKDLTRKGVVRNDKGGILRIQYLTKADLDKYRALGYKIDNNDDLIILTALKIKEEEEKKDDDEQLKTIFVSNDYAARIKSVTYDIPAEIHKSTKIPDEFIDYNGYRTVIKPVSFFGKFDETGEKIGFILNKLPATFTPSKLGMTDKEIIPNEFLLFEADPEDEDYYRLSKKELKQLKAVYRFKGDKKTGRYTKRSLTYRGMYGNISGKNLEQSVVLDLLIDDEVKVVTMRSPAGGGKTFLSLAVALTKILNKSNKYEKIIFLKPTVSVSEDIGFLPGSADDKLGPYMNSFVDNINTLKKMNTVSNKETSDSYDKLIKDGKIEIESISFIRGRSFNDCIIITDEMQNVDNGVIKTILSRVGNNCRVFALGDVEQIDAPYLSKENNGLSHLIRKFKGQEIYGHVSLQKCERSEVSRIAGKYL
jgi:PhoH-like ATPase